MCIGNLLPYPKLVFFRHKDGELFSLQSPQPQQVFGLRAGMSAHYLLQVYSVFQQANRMLGKRLKIFAEGSGPSSSSQNGPTRQVGKLFRFEQP
jgi:hypothetical protein